MTTNEWRTIPDFDRYEVSNDGRVRSLQPGRYRHGNVLQAKERDGYRFVTLRRDSKSITRPVHQLVLEAFVGPRPDGQLTRHLNHIRHDNRPENLAWGTPADNGADRRRNGPRAPRRAELWNR